MKTMSEQAQVAKLVRQYLKKKGIKCRATSKGYSMGDNVNVKVYDQTPQVIKEITEHCGQYQYGHFDGMTDMYEYSNRQHDIPQTKYLFINNDYSEELEQAAWTFVRENIQDANEHPEILKDVSNSARVFDEWVHTFVYQILSGFRDSLSKDFWKSYLPENEVVACQLTHETGIEITVREGTKPGFSEIVFSSKPDRETLDSMKAAGFRWSRFNGCWWGKTENLPNMEGETTPASTPNKKRTVKKVDHSAKLRTLGDKLQNQIDNKLADRQTNTPKRLAQAAHSRLDGERLERTQKALYALADLHESGKVPDSLEKFTTKKSIYELMGTKKEPIRNGYHGYSHCTGEPYFDTEESKALWSLLDGETEEQKEEKVLREKVAQLQFSNIAGFFPTPSAVAEHMLDLLCIEEGQDVLEPSAGSGSLLDIVDHAPFNGGRRVAVEVNHTLSEILKMKNKKWLIHNSDFMEDFKESGFDRIIMNPPFEQLQDIDHIRHAYDLLNPGGKLVSVASSSVTFNSRKKAASFREWLDSIGGEIVELPPGSFKESGTGANSVLVVADKV